MRSDYQVGDELYKVRFGKKIGYYKIKIVFRDERHNNVYYEYIKKGSSKGRRRVLVGKKILAYYGTFFEDKISMLLHLDAYKGRSGVDVYGDKFIALTDQVAEEIERSKINNTEFWV